MKILPKAIKNALVLALHELENMREIEGEILKKELNKSASMKSKIICP